MNRIRETSVCGAFACASAAMAVAPAALIFFAFGAGHAEAQCAADQSSCKAAESGTPAPKLANRLDEIGPLLVKCLRLPPTELARPGMRVTLRIAFSRDGSILGEPRFTYVTPGVPVEIKAAYQRALVDMLDHCTPLPITTELGGAIAGRPLVFPIIDTRMDRRA